MDKIEKRLFLWYIVWTAIAIGALWNIEADGAKQVISVIIFACATTFLSNRGTLLSFYQQNKKELGKLKKKF